MTKDTSHPYDFPAPIALVTGAGHGIGQAVALLLAQKGIHCLLLGRTHSALEKTAMLISTQTNQTPTLLPLDLAETDKIDPLGPFIANTFGKLDIFVHAAWHHGMPTPITHLSNVELHKALHINIAASIRLIRTLSPLLEKSPQGRAVFLSPQRNEKQKTTSDMAYLGIYYSAKMSVNTVFTAWSEECSLAQSLKISVFEAPPTATATRRKFYPGET